MKPVFDVLHGMAGFFLQLAEPLLLLAVGIVEVAVGELAPLLLGFTLELVPVAPGLELGWSLTLFWFTSMRMKEKVEK